MTDDKHDFVNTATTVAAPPALVSYTQWIYALHALSILIGILSSAFIVTMFVFGVPSIVAVVMNYARRKEARGTWLDSHFRWQIRTFWFALLWVVAASLLFGLPALFLIGIIPLFACYAIVGVWAVYRVARGWIALRNGSALPVPGERPT